MTNHVSARVAWHMDGWNGHICRNHWQTKKAWNDRFFPGRLLTTEESGDLSKEANALIEQYFS